MNSRCLPLILLLLCCTVSLATAGGMAKISVSPAEANWKTGQTVEVKVMLDNNLKPLAKDISIYLDFNHEMLTYESCDFKVGHSTVAGLLSSHELNLMLGDFTNGYQNGNYPLAVLKFRTIAPGDAAVLLKVARLNDMDNNPVKFVTAKGLYTITGDAVAKPSSLPTTVVTTYVPSGGQPPVIVVTPGTFTPIPTVPPTVIVPPTVLPATAAPIVPPVQQNTLSPGGVPGWPAVTPGGAVATAMPTTEATTIPTPIPTTVVTTVITTVPTQVFTTQPTRTQVTTAPTTTVTTTVPTTTVTTTTTVPTTTVTEEETWTPIPTTFGQIAYHTGVETPATEETLEETPTVDRTIPSPLGEGANWSDDEGEADWPTDESPTVTPAFGGRAGNNSVVNNTSASLGPVGSIFGDAWMIVLAGLAGVLLVAVGVVAVRRTREDEL